MAEANPDYFGAPVSTEPELAVVNSDETTVAPAKQSDGSYKVTAKADDTVKLEVTNIGETAEPVWTTDNEAVAAVDQNGLAGHGRDGRRERRAAKPADALDHERRAREQRAGGAGGDEAVRLSVAQEVQSHGERGILLLLEGRRGIVADLHDLLGVGDLDALRDLLAAGLFQLAQDVRRAAGENDVRAVFFAGEQRAADGSLGGEIAAHRVNDDLHGFPPLRRRGRSRAGCR